MTGLRTAGDRCGERLSGIMARVALKDARAFDELHALTRNKLRKAAFEVGVSPGDVEDVVQEAYVKIWRNAGKFDLRRASVSTWMSTITRNTAIDAVRARKPQTG